MLRREIGNISALTIQAREFPPHEHWSNQKYGAVKDCTIALPALYPFALYPFAMKKTAWHYTCNLRTSTSTD